ncbi:MAG: DUF3310 domain-containing protein [Arcobacter sp.]
MSDLVNKAPHYNANPSGIECIEVAENLTFCLGNALKYLWRCGEKGSRKQDLEKALYYIQRNRRCHVISFYNRSDFNKVTSSVSKDIAVAMQGILDLTHHHTGTKKYNEIEEKILTSINNELTKENEDVSSMS